MQSNVEKNIANRLGVSLKRADEVLKETLLAIMEETKNDKDGNLRLNGFGAFKLVFKKERKGVSNLNGKEWTKPARFVVDFNPYKAFKTMINVSLILLIACVACVAQTEPIEPVIEPNFVDWVKSNYIVIIGGIMAILEIIARLTPTEKDNNLLRTLQSWLDIFIPNRKKQGDGNFTAFQDKKDTPKLGVVMGEPKSKNCKNQNCKYA